MQLRNLWLCVIGLEDDKFQCLKQYKKMIIQFRFIKLYEICIHIQKKKRSSNINQHEVSIIIAE